MIERLEVKMSEGDGGGGRNEIRGGEEGNLLMHYSARTQTAGRALSEVLRSHTHTHTHTHTHSHRHKRPRRQNERIVWALKPQTKHWERTHMLPLTQRYTHARSPARPHKHKAKHAYLLIWFHGKYELTADVPSYHDFLISWFQFCILLPTTFHSRTVKRQQLVILMHENILRLCLQRPPLRSLLSVGIT